MANCSNFNYEVALNLSLKAQKIAVSSLKKNKTGKASRPLLLEHCFSKTEGAKGPQLASVATQTAHTRTKKQSVPRASQP